MATGQHPLQHHSKAEIATIASWFHHTRKTLLHADANSLDLAPKPIKVSKLKYKEDDSETDTEEEEEESRKKKKATKKAAAASKKK